MRFKRNKRHLIDLDTQFRDAAIAFINTFMQDEKAPDELKIRVLKIISFMEVIMSKESAKKATFKDLIAKKIKKENKQYMTKDIYVTSMDATLTFRTPTDDQVLDTIDEMGDMKDTRKVIAGYKKLIYLCCDMLQNPELHKELEVIDPFDTIDKLFDLGDIMEIGEQVMDLINIGGKVEEIKN